jgi:NTP pyrophosphatase (non-canonical NTP hydrolase)
MAKKRKSAVTFEEVREKALAFRAERDWEQFHRPKDLAEGLAIEAAELLENFLWKTSEQSRRVTKKEMKNIREEVGDVFLFLVYFCEAFDIDIFEAAADKLRLNARKYPAHKVRGKAKKYTEYR